MKKAELRMIYREKRLALTTQEENIALSKMGKILMGFCFKNPINYLLSYQPIEKFKEINPSFFEQILQLQNPNLIISYPITNKDEMKAVTPLHNTTFIKGNLGISEPLQYEILNPSQIDVIFVPLLAFDTCGHRVGYGKGFYDRFFKKCKPDVIKIGLSYFEPIKEITDHHNEDVPLDFCLTPFQLYRF